MSQRLTEPQRRAVDPAASVWVEASAGTGKTQVLTARVLRLLLGGTAPTRILCLTFTKAAAAEMHARIADRLGLWAMESEDRLVADIAALEGKPPDAALMARARRLFARVLDAPGGLRIMTIHAFCQSVLRRFPLEAGVVPHFTVLDDTSAGELMRGARDALLRAEGQAPALGDPLRLVAEQVGEDDFAQLMALLARERGRLHRALTEAGGIEGLARALRRRHGVEGVSGDDALVAAAIANGAYDRPALTAACRALLEGSKSDAERGQAIADWLAADQAKRTAMLDAYAGCYLTKDGDVRKTLATKSVEQKNPGTVAALQAEAHRLLALAERRRAFAVAQASEAIARLGAAMLDRYERAKRDAAALDYDDLIEATCRLLERPDTAAWVLFKLDGGLDHILIDEAQDTNPEQWRVVRALAEEFFAGMGARDAVRTVFAVGDPKQSIFSFQRADPAAFEAMRRHFADRVRRVGSEWYDEALAISFRSTRPVLALVDAVFALGPARDGVVAPGRDDLAHEAYRAEDAGMVELWPIAAQIGDDQPEPWAPPTERSDTDSPRARLAKWIAQQIADWIEFPRLLPSANRPIRPGDVMILVRRRDALVEELVRALKDRRVPVAGVDRMVLTEQLAVMDLMALGEALLLPDDDLTLATVLKSPLFGLTEDQLFALAHGRAGRLWPALNARAAADPGGPEAMALAEFDWLLKRADFLSPHALYAEALSARGGRARLLKRLGPDAADPLDEFLAAALAYERAHPPSLQGFLHWLRAGAAEIKRDLDQAGRDEVRIMTVHGAKGLQAPVVILPDTGQVPRELPHVLWSEGDLPIWAPRVAVADRVAEAARAAAKAAQDQEYRRLLYVALTRAQDRLYVTGWRGKGAAPEHCWYNLIQRGADRLRGATPLLLPDLPADGWEGRALRYESAQLALPERRDAATSAAGAAPLPEWARLPPPPEPDPPRPLVPSQPEPEEGEPPVVAPIGAQEQRRFRRGLIIHRLLQILPELPPEQRRAAAVRLADRLARDLPAEARADIAAVAMGVMERPDLAPLFAPGSRAEAPIVGRVGGHILSGQIDRIVVTDAEVLVVDYKTNRPPPVRVEDVPASYLRQMAAYRAAIAAVYPGKPVKALLLWTDGPSAMALPDALLDRFDPARRAPGAPP